MASLSRKGKLGKVKPEMNVTPLVDVVLVLLIIFMVILPAVNSDLNIEMAKIENADKQEEDDPFVLSIDAEGQLYLDQFRVDAANLEEHLRAANAKEPDKKLSVRGDRRVTYDKVRGVMAVVQNVGFPGVKLRVSKTAVEDASSFAKSVHRTKGGS